MNHYPNLLIVGHLPGKFGDSATVEIALSGNKMAGITSLHNQQQLNKLFADVPHNFYGPCKVCDADATGLHYGVATCEGCKGFFKRSLESATGCQQYTCATGLNNCVVRPQTRNACRACRLRKCREVGMEWKAHRKRIRMKNLINEAKLDGEAHAGSSPGQSVRNDQQQQLRAATRENVPKVVSKAAVDGQALKNKYAAVSADDDDVDDDIHRNGLDGNFGQLFLTVDELLQSRQSMHQQLPTSDLNYAENGLRNMPVTVDETCSPGQQQKASLAPVADDVESRFRRLLPPKKAYTWTNSAHSLQPHHFSPSLLSPNSSANNVLTAEKHNKSQPTSSHDASSSSLPETSSPLTSKSGSTREDELEADEFFVDHLSHLMLHNLTLCPTTSSSSNGANKQSSENGRKPRDKSNRSMLLHRFDIVGLLQDYLILQVLQRTSKPSPNGSLRQQVDIKRKHERDYQALHAICELDPTNYCSSDQVAEQNGLSSRSKKVRQNSTIVVEDIDGDHNVGVVDAGVREEIRRCIVNMMIVHADNKVVNSGKNGKSDVAAVRRDSSDRHHYAQVQRFLAEFADQQRLSISSTTESSLIDLRFGDILRPNTTVITTSVQELHKGFVDCFLEPLVGGRSLQRLLREQPVYEPQTSIDGFMSAFSVHMAQMAVLGIRFGNNFVPGFWRFDAELKHFCVVANLTLTFYTIFAELIEQNNSYVLLNDLNEDNVHVDHKPPTNLADCLHTSYYWIRFVMPDALMTFNKELAAFILSMHLPDRVRIILASAAWCFPPDFSHIPERFRSLVMASMTRLTNRKLLQYQRELRPMHDYLLRIVMAAINFCFSYDEQESRILRNKVLFLFRVVSMRIALYTCYFIRNIPIRFYDDGTFDWQRLRTFTNVICTPEMTYWMNGIWTLTNAGVVDFGDPRFDVEQVAQQMELSLADMGGGSVASWTV